MGQEGTEASAASRRQFHPVDPFRRLHQFLPLRVSG